jgi:YQGE family putative transporter
MRNEVLNKLIFNPPKFTGHVGKSLLVKDLPSDTRNLVWIQFLATFSSALAGIFVNIFLWRQAQNFTPLVIFNFFNVLFIGVIYIASAYLFQRRSSAFGLRMGLLFFVLFYFSLLFLGGKAISWVIPLGCLIGIANGFYWSGLNLLQYVLTHDKNRDFYFGTVGFWVTLAGMAGPIIGGGIITLGEIFAPGQLLGYYLLFLLTSALFSLTAYFSFRLKRLYLTKFSPKSIIFSIKKNRSWRLVLGQQFLTGFYDVSFMVLIGILAYLILANNEFFVGTFQTSMSIIGALGSLVAGKVIIEKRRTILAFLGAITKVLGSVFLGLWPFTPVLIFAGLIKKSFSPLLEVTLGTLYFRAMDMDSRPWQEKYEYMIVRDTVLNMGRLSSYLILFFLFERFSQMTVARGWIIVAGAIPILVWVLVWQMNKGHR